MRQALRLLVLVLGLSGLLVVGLLQRGTRHRDIGSEGASDGSYSPAHLRLLEYLGPDRPIAARLSGQQDYRPYALRRAMRQSQPRATSRGAGGPLAQEASATLIPSEISLPLLHAVRQQPSPENLAALAVLDLVAGQRDKAIQGLRRALAERPEDPRLLNDLAASLLSEAEATGELRPALAAVEEALHAVHASPSPPALFNAALSLERLGLRTRAAEAWRRYLDQDTRSGWAREAAERLDRLEGELAEWRSEAESNARLGFDPAALGHNPWADRQLGEQTLFARWAERTLAGDRIGAEAALAAAEAVAASLASGAGRLLAASAAAIREAEREGDRVRLNRLAHGHDAYGHAYRLRRSEHSEQAGRLLGVAIDDLHSAGSPFELRARLLREVSSPEADWAEIQLVEQVGAEEGFSALVAEARSQAAYRLTMEGRLASARDAYGEAQQRFLDLGEHEIAAVTAAMRGEVLDLIGSQPLAWPELSPALARAPAASDPWSRYAIYAVAASTTTGSYPRAAVELLREAAEGCRALPERPLCAVDSLLWVARVTPDSEVAGEALARAEALLGAVPDSDGKKRTFADLVAARGRWLGDKTQPVGDQEKAAELLADATRRYQALGLAPSAARSQAERARLLERLGRGEESEADYLAALGTFRIWDQTDRFRPDGAEKRLPPELRAVYERLLDLALAAPGAPSPTAFLLAEEMHDRLAPRRTGRFELAREADLQQWTAAMPAGTAAVEYAVSSGRVTAWILTPGRFDQVALAPRAGLAERVRAVAAIRQAEAWRRQTGDLFKELLAPVMARLATGTARLVVIPDGNLHDLPFRALWDDAAGRYLDEELTVAVAPSMRQALRALPAGQPAGAPGGPLAGLSLGFAEFAPDLGLPRLARAAAEATAVQTVYGPSQTCKVDGWQTFRRGAAGADVIHLATHAAADSTSGGTWLAFPRETVTLDRLWRELPELPARPFVVLSSCRSAAKAGGSEGLGGLARPFLASGARAVVGTLWEIEDEEAATLFPALHRAYRRSGDAAAALREAREALPRWRQRPWAWGGSVAIAGVAGPR